MPTIQFKGKSFVQNHHLSVPYHQLIPKNDKSLTDTVSLHDNIIVNGDNLVALKSLLPTYGGKVKCIYIDPPYNTGNESWVYNDNVRSPFIKEWLGKVVGKEDEDFTRHDKWLSMMMPRLKLLRELLTDDGAIFISIDENEAHRLRALMDEIFGSENFLCNFIWQKRYGPPPDTKDIGYVHENIVMYRKSSSFKRNLLALTDEQKDRYVNPDNDPRGPWKSMDYTCRYSKDERPNLYYPILNPHTGEDVMPNPRRVWAFSREQHEINVQENRLWWGKDGKATKPAKKNFLSDIQQGIMPVSLLGYDQVGHTDEASKELNAILPEFKFTPKPTRLVKHLLSIASDKDSIILDSFAGSGTTAHSVLELNKEDGGNRKFILVELEDYANKVTAERVRRVIKGVPESKNDLVKQGLGGSFSYFELGKPIETEGILDGSSLPSYLELARYVYYTATGEEFDESKLNEESGFIGASSYYDVYMIYKPDIEYLKQTALTLNKARDLREQAGSRPLLVFAPTKYVETGELEELKIDFCQLPFEIYKVSK